MFTFKDDSCSAAVWTWMLQGVMFRFKVAESSVCPHCVNDQEDAEHVLFLCPHFLKHCHDLKIYPPPCGDLGHLVVAMVTPDKLVDYMLQSAELWMAVAKFAE